MSSKLSSFHGASPRGFAVSVKKGYHIAALVNNFASLHGRTYRPSPAKTKNVWLWKKIGNGSVRNTIPDLSSMPLLGIARANPEDISAKCKSIPFSELVNTKVFLSRWKQLRAKKGNLAKKVAAAWNLAHQQITTLELNMQAMIWKTSGKLPNI